MHGCAGKGQSPHDRGQEVHVDHCSFVADSFQPSSRLIVHQHQESLCIPGFAGIVFLPAAKPAGICFANVIVVGGHLVACSC